MHTTRSSRNVVVWAVCLLVTLALGGVVAWADEWGSGPKSLTVKPNAEMAEDIATADVQIDAYRIAYATRNASYLTYDYALASPFKENEKVAADMESGDWEALATDALAVVTDELARGDESVLGEPVTGKLGDTILLSTADSEGDGVYLVLPHGADKDADSLTACSKVWEYTFNPIIIALPTKDDVAEGEVLNSAYGNWVADATIDLKATRKVRFGSLRIVKNVTDFAGEPATFVFHVVDKATGGEVYDNYASVYFDGTESNYTVLNNIPAEIEVTITEEYDGARYIASDGTTRETTIKAGDTVEVTFTNKPDGSGKGGHGIENHFVYGKDEGGEAWQWESATPAEETNIDSAKGDKA